MTILRISGFVEPVGPLHRRRVRTEDGRGGAPMDQMMNVIVVNRLYFSAIIGTYGKPNEEIDFVTYRCTD